MKKFFILFISVFFIASITSAAKQSTLEEAIQSGNGRYILKNASISINKIPKDTDVFISLRDKIAKEPMGGFAIFVISMIKYGEDKQMGLQFFTIAMDRNSLSETSQSGNYKGFLPGSSAMYSIKQMDTRKYLGNIFITGTTYTNGYELPDSPYVIRFRQATIDSEDSIKLFALTTSGNSARPITLKRNDKGIWKAYEFSSVFVGVSQLPKEKVSDDL